MKKLTTALVAGVMTLAFAGAYAADDTAKKSDTAATKSDKGMAKKDAKSKAGDKDAKSKKGSGDTGTGTPK